MEIENKEQELYLKKLKKSNVRLESLLHAWMYKLWSGLEWKSLHHHGDAPLLAKLGKDKLIDTLRVGYEVS